MFHEVYRKSGQYRTYERAEGDSEYPFRQGRYPSVVNPNHDKTCNIGWRASVARCSPNRAYLLGSECYGKAVVIGTYQWRLGRQPLSPDNFYHARRSLFQPHIGGAARCRPAVRSIYYATINDS